MISYADYLTHPKPKKTYISTFLSHLIKKKSIFGIQIFYINVLLKKTNLL